MVHSYKEVNKYANILAAKYTLEVDSIFFDVAPNIIRSLLEDDVKGVLTHILVFL